MSAQLIAIFFPGTKWKAIADKALDFVGQAEAFVDLPGSQKREWVKDKLFELYPVPALRLIYRIIEDALTVRTANDTAPLLKK